MLWGGPVEAWRVEFQLRRTILHQLRINTVADLQAQAGGLWTYLTGEWCSLRLQDDGNTKRRTVHPWWQSVQNLADLFGPACIISRDLGDVPKVPADWYLAHIAGCVAPFAARQGISDLRRALIAISRGILPKLQAKPWADEYVHQCIRLQQNPELDGEGGCDVPF